MYCCILYVNGTLVSHDTVVVGSLQAVLSVIRSSAGITGLFRTPVYKKCGFVHSCMSCGILTLSNQVVLFVVRYGLDSLNKTLRALCLDQ